MRCWSIAIVSARENWSHFVRFLRRCSTGVALVTLDFLYLLLGRKLISELPRRSILTTGELRLDALSSPANSENSGDPGLFTVDKDETICGLLTRQVRAIWNGAHQLVAGYLLTHPEREQVARTQMRGIALR